MKTRQYDEIELSMAFNDNVDVRLDEWQRRQLCALIHCANRQDGAHIDSLPIEANLPVNDKPLVTTLKSFEICFRFKDEQIVSQVIDAPTGRMALVLAARNIRLSDVRGATASSVR